MFKIKGLTEPRPNKVVELYLEKEGDTVYLKGEDSDELSWYILKFFEDGTFARSQSVEKDIGITIDRLGRIKEVAE